MFGIFRRSKLTEILFFEMFLGFEGISTAWAWVNPGFEAGSLAGWTTSSGSAVSMVCQPNASLVQSGPATNSNGGLNMTHTGNFAAQLFSGRGDNNHQDWASIQQTDTVPSNGQCCLSFWFAGVFENYHFQKNDLTGDTFLRADVLVGGAVVAAVSYNWANNLGQIVVDGLTGNGGNGACTINGTPNDWGYLPWTQYTINLCKYGGQQVTLRVTDFDCDAGGHYGYGFLDDVSWISCPTPLITLVKSNSPAGQVSLGQTITYTLTYANTGASPIDGVVINDTVPAGTTYVPNSMGSSPNIPITAILGNDLIWNVGYLYPGNSGTLTFQVVADTCGETIVNVAAESDLETAGLTSNTVTNTVTACTPTPTATGLATKTSTSTSTFSFTGTSTFTRTSTASPTPTASFTSTSSYTFTATKSFSPSFTPSFTRTATSSPTNSPTPSPTSTATPTFTRTFSPTATHSFTSTSTFTSTFSPTHTRTSTHTFTATSSFTSTHTSTPTFTSTSTFTSTHTFTSTWTFTPTVTPTPTKTFTFTHTPTPTFTFTATCTPTNSYTPTPGVQIQKFASEFTARMGDTITYTISLTVSGSIALNVTVIDTLPAEVTFVGFGSPSTPPLSLRAQGQILTWAFSTLSPGVYSLPYFVKVNSGFTEGFTLINQAGVFHDGGKSIPVTLEVPVPGPYTVRIGVYNEAGELVKSFPLLTFFVPASSLQLSETAITSVSGVVSIFVNGQLVEVWDGSNQTGSPLTNGHYFLKVDNVDPSSLVTSLTQEVTVSRTLSTVTVNVYNEAGEVVKHLYEKVMDAGNGIVKSVQLSTEVIQPNPPSGAAASKGSTILVNLPGTSFTVAWDGTNDQDAVVTNGGYFIETHWLENGADQVNTQRVIVINGGGDPAQGVVFVQPNVVTSGQTTVAFKIHSSMSLTLKVFLFDMAGELVTILNGQPGTNQADYPAVGLASGLYFGKVELYGKDGGLVARQTAKVIIIR